MLMCLEHVEGDFLDPLHFFFHNLLFPEHSGSHLVIIFEETEQMEGKAIDTGDGFEKGQESQRIPW